MLPPLSKNHHHHHENHPQPTPPMSSMVPILYTQIHQQPRAVRLHVQPINTTSSLIRTKEKSIQLANRGGRIGRIYSPKEARLASQGFMLNAVLAFLSEESAMTLGKRLLTVDQESRDSLLRRRSRLEVTMMQARARQALQQRMRLVVALDLRVGISTLPLTGHPLPRQATQEPYQLYLGSFFFLQWINFHLCWHSISTDLMVECHQP